jgi:uncharacterized protein (TIGR02246 family)
MQKCILCLLLATSMVGVAKLQGTPGAKPDKDEEVKKEILKLEDERDQALMRNDADWFERVFADDIAYTGGNGAMPTKAEIVAEIRSRERKWQAVQHDDYRVRVYGNTAVATYFSHSTMEYKGKVSTNLGRTTDVYVKQDGVWRAVVHHVSAVTKQ